MARWLDKLLMGVGARRGESVMPTRLRTSLSDPGAAVYAIGDVHGCLHLLLGLEAQILADAATLPGHKTLVMLGDYIDRGPHSALVIDHLLVPLTGGVIRYCITGNHEAAMLDFIEDRDPGGDWLGLGGTATLFSYGIEVSSRARQRLGHRQWRALLQSHIPDEHLRFLASLPVLLQTPNQIFVHAGLRPGVALDSQSETDLMWIRDNFENDYIGFGKTIVHGHIPRTDPLIIPTRVALDTGAYATGRLCAIRFGGGTRPKLFEQRLTTAGKLPLT